MPLHAAPPSSRPLRAGQLQATPPQLLPVRRAGQLQATPPQLLPAAATPSWPHLTVSQRRLGREPLGQARVRTMLGPSPRAVSSRLGLASFGSSFLQTRPEPARAGSRPSLAASTHAKLIISAFTQIIPWYLAIRGAAHINGDLGPPVVCHMFAV